MKIIDPERERNQNFLKFVRMVALIQLVGSIVYLAIFG